MKAWPVIVPAFMLIVMWSRGWGNPNMGLLEKIILSVFFLAVYSLIYWGVSWSKNRNRK